MINNKKLKDIVNSAKSVGVIGSPSSTGRINVDILETAINERLIGNLGIFNYLQNENEHFALSQFTEITMRNTWSEDPTIRGLIRQKGTIAPITEKQDVHLAQMTVSSVFSSESQEIIPSILGTIPPTGTPVKLFNEDIMNSLFAHLSDQLFYLGKSYGTDIKMPMWFKHFGKGEQGANEAYHLGVFGKTGSGKSYLSLMIMLAYARHSEMGLFVLDPQGEFSEKINSNPQIRSLITQTFNKKVKFVSLHNLVLSGWDLFKKIMIYSDFFKDLGIHHETNQMQAANELVRILKCENPKSIKTWETYKDGAFERFWFEMKKESIIARIYSSQDLRNRVSDSFSEDNKAEIKEKWNKVCNLFKYEGKEYSIIISKLVKEIQEEKGNISIIDLSEMAIPDDLFWNETIKFIVIGEFVKQLTNIAEESYKAGNLLNTLVVIDEAHRLAPREKSPIEDLELLKARFIDGVRTTRKYGLGWMFISQTLSSLDRRIVEQIRIYLFGFGLSWGIERQALLEIIGGQNEALKLYQMFKDPQSALGKREFPFMTIGPISPLSFSGTPLFFNALDFPHEFMKVNFQ
ncbi:MAG: ATP-binding protein [Promethearchaeota archaeon]